MSRRRSPRKLSSRRHIEKEKVIETEVDKKLKLYSQKYSKLNLKKVTDWRNDEFDPMAFLYSDIEPFGMKKSVRPADTLAQLLRRYEKEDGIIQGQ